MDWTVDFTSSVEHSNTVSPNFCFFDLVTFAVSQWYIKLCEKKVVTYTRYFLGVMKYSY